MKQLLIALAAAFAVSAHAQSAKSSSDTVAKVNGVSIPKSRFDFVVRQQTARGQQDTEQLRAQVRELLINQELLSQEAARSGVQKKSEVQLRLDMVRTEVLANSYIDDWLRQHPVSDADIQKEYERVKAETGEREYRARHILVEKEDDAKALIGELKKGAKFDELAQKNSKDTNKERGGDLDWNVPGVFDKPFADALVKLEKGKYTETPVRTRFGYHVIQLDDVRPVKFPPLIQVQPQIRQRLSQQKIEKMVADLRGKAKVE